MRLLKEQLKELLKYTPMLETAQVRTLLTSIEKTKSGFCPAHEGDFLYSLVRSKQSKNALEIGFKTGSTALYLLHAIIKNKGKVTSICMDDFDSIGKARELLRSLNYIEFHTLINENTKIVLPKLLESKQKFDIIFVDGWKTFDHLAFEIYYLNQLLTVQGVIVFDDSFMPAVRKVIRLLQSYYGYEKCSSLLYNQTLTLRLSHLFFYRTLYAPYVALTKLVETENQEPFRDWNFYRPI